MLVPLSIINHYKPTRPLDHGINLDELYPEGFHDRDLMLARDPGKFTWRNFFSNSTACTNSPNGSRKTGFILSANAL